MHFSSAKKVWRIDEVVLDVDVYVERDRNKSSFVPHSRPKSLDPLKIVISGELVDERAITSPKPEHFMAQKEGAVMEGGELESPQPEYALVEEESQGD